MSDRDKVLEILKSYQTAMLVTHDHGDLHARPMQIGKVDDDGRVSFLTGAPSHKVEEIADDAGVLVICQDDRSAYLAIYGRARVTRDPQQVKAVWREPYRTWFPDGPDSPELVLIEVNPDAAEYWDTRGVNKLKYLFSAATAYVKGERPHIEEGEQHGRTAM